MVLEGKKALITGGSRGIGRAVALALAKEGIHTIITYQNNERLAQETANAIKDLGGKVTLHQVNLAYTEEIDDLFNKVQEKFGQLDIFVSNAASTALRPLLDLPVRHWDQIMNINLRAFFYCGLRAAGLMEGGGRIIALSSLGSRMCFPGYAALGVAKAGIETLARYMAVEWADRGINVNVVCGGPIDSQALEAFEKVVPDLNKFKAELSGRTPAGRLGCPQDLAESVVFLCRPEADWIRGQTIVVDGGFSLVSN